MSDTPFALDAAHDVVPERLDQVEHELRLALLQAFDELVDVVADRQNGSHVAAFGKTVLWQGAQKIRFEEI